MKTYLPSLLLGGLVLATAALPMMAQSRGPLSIAPKVPVMPSFSGSSSPMSARPTTPRLGPRLNPRGRGRHPHHLFLPGFGFHPRGHHFHSFHRQAHGFKFKFKGTHFFVGHRLFPVVFFSHLASISDASIVLDPRLAESPVTALAAEEGSTDPNASLARAGAQSAPKAEPVLLVLRNGSIYSAARYWLEGGRIFFLTPDGVEASLPLTELNLEKTARLNADRGVDFLLRLSSTEVRTRPKRAPRHVYVPVTFPPK